MIKGLVCKVVPPKLVKRIPRPRSVAPRGETRDGMFSILNNGSLWQDCSECHLFITIKESILPCALPY